MIRVETKKAHILSAFDQLSLETARDILESDLTPTDIYPELLSPPDFEPSVDGSEYPLDHQHYPPLDVNNIIMNQINHVETSKPEGEEPMDTREGDELDTPLPLNNSTDVPRVYPPTSPIPPVPEEMERGDVKMVNGDSPPENPEEPMEDEGLF